VACAIASGNHNNFTGRTCIRSYGAGARGCLYGFEFRAHELRHRLDSISICKQKKTAGRHDFARVKTTLISRARVGTIFPHEPRWHLVRRWRIFTARRHHYCYALVRRVAETDLTEIMEHPFTWYEYFVQPTALGILPQHSFTALLVTFLLVVIAFLARRSLSRAENSVVPEGGLTLRNLAELLVGFIVGLVDSIIGKKGRNFVALFGSFFFFILAANLIGLVPGFSPPTSNLNTTLALGIVSFLAYNFLGVRAHGAGYLKHFMGPVLFLAPVFMVLEGVSHLVRPVSLGLRLFGNMFGDHLAVEIFTDLSKVGVPVIFYLLGTLVSVIQAFVFTLLSVIYVAMAVSHDH
jgi:F-type H+-transporting ATPase subunit a